MNIPIYSLKGKNVRAEFAIDEKESLIAVVTRRLLKKGEIDVSDKEKEKNFLETSESISNQVWNYLKKTKGRVRQSSIVWTKQSALMVLQALVHACFKSGWLTAKDLYNLVDFAQKTHYTECDQKVKEYLKNNPIK